MSALRRLAQTAPRLTRGLHTSPAAQGGKEAPKWTHSEMVHGDGHHGLRPGYSYDYEHGPHYLDFGKIPNFATKYKMFMAGLFTVGLGIPVFAVWWQQSKLKA